MPTHARTVDYLKSHDSLGRRIRNLETGVHPTTADISYWDDTDWQDAELPEAWTAALDQDFDPIPLAWRRRLGIVHLRGGVRAEAPGTFGAIDEDGAHIATLPAEALPQQDTRLLATIQGQSPYVAPAEIRTDGHLILFRGDITGDYTGSILLNGQTWTTQ